MLTQAQETYQWTKILQLNMVLKVISKPFFFLKHFSVDSLSKLHMEFVDMKIMIIGLLLWDLIVQLDHY